MYRKILKYVISAGLVAAGLVRTSTAQERTVMAGLESDPVYISLIAEEEDLKIREDSLNNKVAETRGLFRSDPDNREVHSQAIVRLETELFDTRNMIGILAGRINTIEQEFIIRNLSGGGVPAQGVENGEGMNDFPEKSAVIVFNPFFETNLPPEDHGTLLEAQQRETEVDRLLKAFRENHERITQIIAENDTTDTPEIADSLYTVYESIYRLNDRLSKQIEEEFGFVYDNKLYSYNYILDKLGLHGQLSAFGKKIIDTREKVLEMTEGAASPAVSAYPYRKALLLEYEETLAGIAGYTLSLDSLRKVAIELGTMDFDLPAVAMEEKLFLDYSDIEFHNPAKYDTRNPIPDLKVHRKGEIYRILLGSFQRAQPVSILKGAYPVGVLREDGRYYYYAGGFATVEEAGHAVEELIAKGFRDPKVACWTNGRYTLFGQDELERILGKTIEGIFRVSIDTGGRPLPDVVKGIIEDISPGAEISRSGELYIIGTFESRPEAEELAEEIESAVDWVETDIENIG